MSPWKVILATMVIFGCGVVTGGLLMKTGLPPVPLRPGGTNQAPMLGNFQRPEFLHRLQKQLDLTSAQYNTVTNIIHASQERSRPLVRMEMKRVREEIRDVLDPDQQKKYDELLRPRLRRGEGAFQATNASKQTNSP